MRAFVEDSPECMMEVAGSGSFQRINASAREFLGYTREELSRLSLDLIGAGSVRRKVHDLGSLGRSRIEGSFVKKNGRAVRAVMHAAAAGDGNFQLILAEIAAARVARERETKGPPTLGLVASPLLLADLSGIRKRFEELRREGLADLGAYLAEDGSRTGLFTSLVRPLAFCRNLGELLGRVEPGTGQEGIQDILARPEMDFGTILVGLWRGGTSSESRASLLLDEGRRSYRLVLKIDPESALTWSKAALAFVDISEETRQQAELAASIEEKTFLLGELRHRVKNSLNLVASMLSLEANSLKDTSCAERLIAAQSRIRMIALSYGKLSHDQDPRVLDCSAYIEEIVCSIKETYLSPQIPVTILTRFDPIRTDSKRAAAIGLIVNEIITNSLKHAFPEGGEGTIEVEMRNQGGALELKVTDDGVGLVADFDAEQGEGLGFQFIRMLASQLSASTQIGCVEGCSFSFTIPLDPR